MKIALKVNYVQLVALHVLLGLVVYLNRDLTRIIFLAAAGFFMVSLISNGNRKDEALMGAAYITGFEVLSRMTGGAFTYEFAKYSVIGFLLVGMFYRGFHRKSWPYILFITLLTPGVIFSVMNLDYETSLANAIGFYLSGPFCLAICARYCYDRKMSFERLQTILTCVLLPLITMATYLYVFTPNLRDSIYGTSSNFITSGMYGPNQVATSLGLGMFILFARLLTIKNRMINILDLLLLAALSYRAIATFSRGGVITAGVCAAIFLVIFYLQLDIKRKALILPKIGLISALMLGVWFWLTILTSGMIVNRYTNQDAAGRLKSDITTGRAELIETELSAFYDKPITGIGVGKIREYRLEKSGILSATHSETSRMLSEHGIFGLVALLILFFTPIVYRFKNTTNVYLFSFLFFWALTINHSSMRIAAPAFIYGLALITVIDVKKKPRTISWK